MAKNDFIGVDPRQQKEVDTLLARLAPQVADEVGDEIGTYLVNVLRAYPSPRKVSRAEAFPNLVIVTKSGKIIRGYKSMKQYRFVQMLRADGKLPYQRTQSLSRGWKKIGKGRNVIVANEVSHGPFMMDPQDQTNMARLIGWKTTDEHLRERAGEINRRGQGVANRVMKKLGAR
jgi:hypothetical protein